MKGEKLDNNFFKSIVQKYYKIRNWNNKGEPTKDVLFKYELL